MAIIQCPECSGQVSTKAATCPHCGAPVPRDESAKAEVGAVTSVRPSVPQPVDKPVPPVRKPQPQVENPPSLIAEFDRLIQPFIERERFILLYGRRLQKLQILIFGIGAVCFLPFVPAFLKVASATLSGSRGGIPFFQLSPEGWLFLLLYATPFVIYCVTLIAISWLRNKVLEKAEFNGNKTLSAFEEKFSSGTPAERRQVLQLITHSNLGSDYFDPYIAKIRD